MDVGAPDSCPWEMAQQVSACGARLTRLLAPAKPMPSGALDTCLSPRSRPSVLGWRPNRHAARSRRIASAGRKRRETLRKIQHARMMPGRCGFLSIRHREPGAGALQGRIESGSRCGSRSNGPSWMRAAAATLGKRVGRLRFGAGSEKSGSWYGTLR